MRTLRGAAPLEGSGRIITMAKTTTALNWEQKKALSFSRYWEVDKEGKTCITTFTSQEIPVLKRLMTLAVVCWVVRRRQLFKSRSSRGVFWALAPTTLIQSPLLCCHCLQPITVHLASSGKVDPSFPRRLWCCQGKWQARFWGSVLAPWPMQMLSLMLAVFVFIFEADVL